MFLVIDGWAAFRKDFEGLADTVQEIAQRGLGYGVHVIFSTGRWADFRLHMQAVIGTKIELRINDPMDSVFGRRNMEKLMSAPTGRALTAGFLQSQLALPTLNQSDLFAQASGQDVVATIASAWTGPKAPGIRMLPTMVNYNSLRAQNDHESPALIGIAEADLAPTTFDFNGNQRYTIIYGDSGSGKTSTLRTFINEILLNSNPGGVMFGVIDTRRSLLGYMDDKYLGGYGGTRKASEILVEAMRRELDRRLPPADVTVEQLRTRSWWKGPEMYIIVDDFDMIEGTNNPLKPLISYLPQSSDIGLHIIVARRSAGAGRAGYESFLQALRESGANSLLLSGEKQEGQIWPGVKMKQFPPGRAQWIDRSGIPRVIQLAYTPAP